MTLTTQFAADVQAGLADNPPTLPCKYLYDARGAELFSRICEVDAYYPTRTELAILDANRAAIRDAVGPARRVAEFGSGDGTKTRWLLDTLDAPAGYVPIDISEEQLRVNAAKLNEEFPDVEVTPVHGDFEAPVQLPETTRDDEGVLVFFPGSTIGNFNPSEAEAFLARAANLAGEGGQLLVGADLRKDPEVLERAYNDPEGVTAAFNLNLLQRMRDELGAELELDAFEHQAPYDREAGRIEMRLVAKRPTSIRVGDQARDFAAGDYIVTEHSHKYSIEGFAEIAQAAGWSVQQVWTDDDDLFSVQLLERSA